MSKKVFNVFSILCFALVLCFMGCTELINPKTETDINLNIDLSKIIKSTRNTGETQSSASIDENPTIKVAIYDAKKYTATTNSTENLGLITEAQAKIVDNEAKVKLNNIPVGIYAIVFAELSFSNGNSTEVMYAGNSEVFRVEPTDNKISLVLNKVGNSETSPDDTNTPYGISSWEDLEIEINKLSDDTITTKFVIMDNLIATKTITVSTPVKIIAESPVTITRGNTTGITSFTDVFFKVETSGSLELEGKENSTITLDGGNQSSTNYGGAVYVSGGTFTMNYGVTITKCHAEDGGAVYITDKGTFNMNGGSIAGCSASNSGGGVWMNSGSSFTMSGGKIYNCNSSFEGGGVYVTGEDNPCTFEMLDNATIIECSAVNGGGGGVYVTGKDNPCTFKMLDSYIIGCSAVNGGGGVSYDCGLNGTFEISGTAKISDNENISSIYGGGGIYLYGKLTMTGGTISSNEASNGNGDGVYVRNVNGVLSSLSMSGNAIIEAYDDVYLESGTTVTVAGDLTAGKVATIMLVSYTEGTQVLTADNTNLLVQSVGKFALADTSEKFTIGEDGKIALVSQNYAEGLTYANDTLYISNAQGLATFRNIVNGTLTYNIIVAKNTSVSDALDQTFNMLTQYSTINAELVNDIDLNDMENWTPIGNSLSDKTYKGSFDGKKYAISNLTIDNTTGTNPIGLFGAIEGGTVKNLVVQGKITSSYYTGGITAYLNGGTIENCVNNVEITNFATNGTGGIVGYVENSTATIKNCVNMAKVESTQSTVGGIVGATSVMSETNVSISKCINMGEIFGTSNVSGILGTASASQITISDCMNIGKILANNSSNNAYAYASGITTPTAACTVSSCINVGEVTATGTSSFQGGISSVTSDGIYTNNYYDSTKITPDDKVGITGKDTSELIALSSTDLSDQWTFVVGRYYPLPDIAGSIPGGEDGEIWSDVLKAATPEVATGGGNEPLDGIKVSSLGDLQNAINGNDEVIIITSNITITNPLVINRKIKICTSDSNYQLARATEGTEKGPMFEVTSTGELTLQNIIITGGYDSGYDDAENNPFIYNNGKTVIENSTLKNNYLYYTNAYTNNESNVIHFYGGGAIFSNGDLTINNSSMENFYINTSNTYGGTIYIESGTCNIDVLTISKCSSNKNGAALYISDKASSSTVNINNSNIVSNTAVSNGGGIYAAAGTINIINSEINNNSAQNGKSVYFKKGVIYSINSNEPVTVPTTGGYNEDITSSTSSISIN